MAKVEIIRTRNEVNVTLHSGRPGVVIGPRGGEVDKLREELEGVTGRKVTVNVIEIKEPDLNATLVGEGIAEQLGQACVVPADDEAVLRSGDERRRQGRQDHLCRTAGRLGNGPHAKRRRWGAFRCTRWMPMWTTPGDRPDDVRGDRHQGVDLPRQVRRSAGAAASTGGVGRRGGWGRVDRVGRGRATRESRGAESPDRGQGGPGQSGPASVAASGRSVLSGRP